MKSSKKVSVKKKRIWSHINFGLSLVFAILLVGMWNYIAGKHEIRADWSKTKYYSLSGKTESLLRIVNNRLDIVVFFQNDHELYEDIRNLLDSYQHESDFIKIEWVDPNRDLTRTEELVKKYGISEIETIVFDYEGRNKFVGEKEIADYDSSNQKSKDEKPTLVAFRGEEAFSSAIQSVIQEKKPVVYFTQGHGERSPANFDKLKGYSEIGKIIQRDNVDPRPLLFGRDQRVPEDCDALVIAGPTKKFAPEEVALIDSYLKHGGRVLVLLDALVDTGLEGMLKDWGVAVSQDIVIDPKRTLKGRGILLAAYSEHKITEQMREFSSIFQLPRSVRPTAIANTLWQKAEDKPKVQGLFFASKDAWSESQPSQIPAQYDPTTPDFKSPNGVSMGVVVEKGAEGLDVHIRPSRMVVIGDSDFASNSGMTGGAQDVFMSSLNWLLEREELIGIAPKPSQKVKLFITRPELNKLFWIVLLAVPGLFAFIGFMVWLRRRS